MSMYDEARQGARMSDPLIDAKTGKPVKRQRPPAVDWLDEGRESCLIDGVRYTREDGPPEGAIIVWADCGDIGDGDYRVWLAADADLEQMMPPDSEGFFYFWPVPIDQHPDDPCICKNGFGMNLSCPVHAPARRPAPVEEEATDEATE